MISLVHGTPVETHDGILVKREDLCSPFPGPSFAKIRGVVAHIKKRPETLIGVLDTFHSKAGWAVSYICAALGKRTLNFFPKYKNDLILRRQQAVARSFGAELVALQAGRSAVLYHQAKRQAAAAGGYMMPNALKLPETVTEVAAEVARTRAAADHLVISVSSGTIAAGVILGLARTERFPELWLHMGYDRSETELRAYIQGYAPALGVWPTPVHIVNEHFGYKDAAAGCAPFPCNPYYDLKSWNWLIRERAKLRGRTLFWNIGA
jgi:hypothetical protein